MTIDEAIKYAEEVAEEQENKFSISGEFLGNNADCKKCASEHRQLAEWLKELKKLREQTRWTPVSEGLPEPWASVLITFSGKYGCLTADHAVGTGSYDGANGWFIDNIAGYTDWLTVEAWMNLPESYKEG